MKWKALLASSLLIVFFLIEQESSPARAQVMARTGSAAPASPIAPVLPASDPGALSPAVLDMPLNAALPDLPAPLPLPAAGDALAAPRLETLAANPASLLSGPSPVSAPYIDPALLALPVSMDSDIPGRQRPPAAIADAGRAETPARETLHSLETFAASIAGPREESGRGSARTDPSAAFFDQNLRARSDADAAPAGVPAAPPSVPSDGASLARRRPRVVLMLDTFEGPAPQAAVEAVEKLLDNNVRVLFITPRPERGDNSAYSVLVDRLRARRENPLLIVSYNGARVTAHTPRRTEASAPFMEDLPGLPEPTLEKFRGVTASLKSKFGIRGEPEEFGRPSMEEAHIYGVHLPRLPKSFKPAAFVSEYNRALRSKGLPYKIEMRAEADGRLYFFTQSTALKVNKGRIQAALYALAPELDPAHGDSQSLKPGQALVLGDPAKAASFLGTLDKGTSIHGVNNAETMTVALRALLGEEALEPVVVWRSDLREYKEWLERKQRFGSSPSISGSARGKRKAGATNQQLAFFKGIVMKAVINRLYYFMRQGQYDLASPEAALDLLKDAWYNPAKHGIYLPEELQLARQTPGWKKLQHGALETARQYLREMYRRNLPNYPQGVSEQVVGRLVNLGSDGKNSVPVSYASPFTGRRYVVWVRPDRVEIKNDDKGWMIVSHVYRTGKEPYSSEFNEWAEVNIVARGALEGYATKGSPLLNQDPNKWYLNDQPDPRVVVVFHYGTRELPKPFTPAQLETYTPQVTALIEKRLTDTDYLAWREAQDRARERAANALRRQVRDQGGKKKGKSS